MTERERPKDQPSVVKVDDRFRVFSDESVARALSNWSEQPFPTLGEQFSGFKAWTEELNEVLQQARAGRPITPNLLPEPEDLSWSTWAYVLNALDPMEEEKQVYCYFNLLLEAVAVARDVWPFDPDIEDIAPLLLLASQDVAFTLSFRGEETGSAFVHLVVEAGEERWEASGSRLLFVLNQLRENGVSFGESDLEILKAAQASQEECLNFLSECHALALFGGSFSIQVQGSGEREQAPQVEVRISEPGALDREGDLCESLAQEWRTIPKLLLLQADAYEVDDRDAELGVWLAELEAWIGDDVLMAAIIMDGKRGEAVRYTVRAFVRGEDELRVQSTEEDLIEAARGAVLSLRARLGNSPPRNALAEAMWRSHVLGLGWLVELAQRREGIVIELRGTDAGARRFRVRRERAEGYFPLAESESKRLADAVRRVLRDDAVENLRVEYCVMAGFILVVLCSGGFPWPLDFAMFFAPFLVAFLMLLSGVFVRRAARASAFAFAGSLLGLLGAPMVIDFLDHRAQNRGDQVYLAVESYLQANGRLPEQLSDLVPQFLVEVPHTGRHWFQRQAFEYWAFGARTFSISYDAGYYMKATRDESGWRWID